ncbi:MAG: hypothetical protein U9R21_08910 [Candidatus Thermoplasmatota archaeon]|nr:hypothetical protein [Candidatus Thermoplasmatota archaeon]
MKLELRDMKLDSCTEGGVCEVNFGCHYDLYGYTTLMSDMTKLGANYGVLCRID